MKVGIPSSRPSLVCSPSGPVVGKYQSVTARPGPIRLGSMIWRKERMEPQENWTSFCMMPATTFAIPR